MRRVTASRALPRRIAREPVRAAVSGCAGETLEGTEPMGKEQFTMGLTRVQITVRNPADSARSWEGPFLVDTGAVDSLIPRERLEQIGLRPEGNRTYELADGRQVEMDITVARLEFMGDVIGATVVIGEEGAEPLLGVTALESMGIEIDPLNQRLRKLPSIRLKAAGRVLDAGSWRLPGT